MQPGDLVALVRTGGGVAILEQFTTDRRVLLEAIDLMKWRFSGRTGLIPITPLSSGAEARSEPGGERREPQILDYGYPMSRPGRARHHRTSDSGDEGVAGPQAHRLLVRRACGWMATSLPPSIRLRIWPTAPPYRLHHRLGRPARAVPGNATRMSGFNSPPPRITLDRFPTLPAADDSDFGMQAGLDALAKRTGGLFYRDRNDIPECMRQATDDQLGVYLLGYSPREAHLREGRRQGEVSSCGGPHAASRVDGPVEERIQRRDRTNSPSRGPLPCPGLERGN